MVQMALALHRPRGPEAVQLPGKHARAPNRPGANHPQCRVFSRLEQAAPVHPAHRRQCCGRRPAPPHWIARHAAHAFAGEPGRIGFGGRSGPPDKWPPRPAVDGVAAIGSSPRVATHRARTPTLDNGASHAPIAATTIGGRSRPSCAVDHRGGRAAKSLDPEHAHKPVGWMRLARSRMSLELSGGSVSGPTLSSPVLRAGAPLRAAQIRVPVAISSTRPSALRTRPHPWEARRRWARAGATAEGWRAPA